MMNEKGMKYLEVHKKWIAQAKELGPQVADFKPDFVKSLELQVEEGNPLTARQFVSLKKTVFFLKHKIAGK